MRRKIFDWKRATALSALLGGLGGCSDAGGVASPGDKSGSKDPIELAAEELGVVVPGCAASGSTYVYASAGGTFTFAVDTDPLVLSSSGGKLTANGYVCVGTVNSVANTQIKLTDIAKIVVNGSTNDNKVILDFLPATFGSKILAANGGIDINFADDGAASSPVAGNGDDSVMIRAGSAAETYKFGKVSGGDIYIETTGDKIADIRVKPSALGTIALSASMGGGADKVFANAVTADFDKFSAATGLTISAMTVGVTAYGGIADDQFTGGNGNDAFYGGDGNDLFKVVGTATDGSDIYSGDNGTDTVDYSSRTLAMNIDLGPQFPSLQGTVDLATPSLYGSTGSLNSKTLGIVFDDQWRVEVPFSAPANPADVLSAINTAANTVIGTTAKVYATMGDQNQLVLSNDATTATVTSPMQIVANPAIAGGGPADAAAVLGLTPSSTDFHSASAQVDASAGITGNVDLSALTLSNLNTKRLVLVVNGQYVSTTLSTPANVAALLTALNLAINSAMDTALSTGVTSTNVYATEDASHFLVLTAKTLSVRNGATAVSFTSGASQLGLTAGAPVSSIADADDGLVDTDSGTVGNQSEADDVRFSTEVIWSGTGNDRLIGNSLKNSIKGNDGNDVISGGSNASCGSTDGDTLLGEAGNDTFISSQANCKATYTGGAGDNVIDMSGRSATLVMKNDGTANDGETSEAANIGSDVQKMIGGFGVDAITGGTGDDILVGGPGGDTLIGGSGFDKVDYSSSPAAVNVSLCFTTAIGSCPAADDGLIDADASTGGNQSEADQVYQIEWLVGSAYADTLSASAASATTDVTIEGGLLADDITGGAGNDTLWGDDGNDYVKGGPGDDNISGGLNDDRLDGGDGDGDICLYDAATDTSYAPVACEL